jgi:hypothetical protein
MKAPDREPKVSEPAACYRPRMDFSFDPVVDAAALAALLITLVEHMQKRTLDPSKKISTHDSSSRTIMNESLVFRQCGRLPGLRGWRRPAHV